MVFRIHGSLGELLPHRTGVLSSPGANRRRLSARLPPAWRLAPLSTVRAPQRLRISLSFPFLLPLVQNNQNGDFRNVQGGTNTLKIVEVP